jgi:hypothetical protein
VIEKDCIHRICSSSLFLVKHFEHLFDLFPQQVFALFNENLVVNNTLEVHPFSEQSMYEECQHRVQIRICEKKPSELYMKYGRKKDLQWGQQERRRGRPVEGRWDEETCQSVRMCSNLVYVHACVRGDHCATGTLGTMRFWILVFWCPASGARIPRECCLCTPSTALATTDWQCQPPIPSPTIDSSLSHPIVAVTDTDCTPSFLFKVFLYFFYVSFPTFGPIRLN